MSIAGHFGSGRVSGMAELSKGGNAPLTGTSFEIAVTGAQQGSVDLLVFQLSGGRKVRSDNDLVFFNQPVSPEGAVRLVAGDRVHIDAGAVPAEIECLAVAVALDEGFPGSLGSVAALGVTISDSGPGQLAPAQGLTTERAAVLVEIYRRGPEWKVRSVSAGWNEGLAGLAREHGVRVTGEPAGPATAVTMPPAAPISRPQAAPQVRTAAGEEKLSLVKRQALDLRKQEVHKVLLTKSASSVRARVVLVIDKTGSMTKQYANKVIHRVVEKMVPVAIQLDDDATLECYLYATSFAKLPDLTVSGLETWPEEFLHLSGTHGGIRYGDIGGMNDEIPIMQEVISSLPQPGSSLPTLVLFFTDGGFSKTRQITELIRQASALPAFWQFVGVGRAKYGVLEKLDELEGRTVDNVGFFAINDIDAVSDADLYAKLLGEFPDWVKAARVAGVLA